VERETTRESDESLPISQEYGTSPSREIIARINGAAQFTAIYRGLSPIPNAPREPYVFGPNPPRTHER